jgi:hypothetical protein
MLGVFQRVKKPILGQNAQCIWAFCPNMANAISLRTTDATGLDDLYGFQDHDRWVSSF